MSTRRWRSRGCTNPSNFSWLPVLLFSAESIRLDRSQRLPCPPRSLSKRRLIFSPRRTCSPCLGRAHPSPTRPVTWPSYPSARTPSTIASESSQIYLSTSHRSLSFHIEPTSPLPSHPSHPDQTPIISRFQTGVMPFGSTHVPSRMSSRQARTRRKNKNCSQFQSHSLEARSVSATLSLLGPSLSPLPQTFAMPILPASSSSLRTSTRMVISRLSRTTMKSTITAETPLWSTTRPLSANGTLGLVPNTSLSSPCDYSGIKENSSLGRTSPMFFRALIWYVSYPQ